MISGEKEASTVSTVETQKTVPARSMKRKPKLTHRSPAEYRTLIRHVENKVCGIPDRRERFLDRLKLEIAVACDKNFWGNPKAPVDRPKIDPGAGGFTAFHRFGFGKGAT